MSRVLIVYSSNKRRIGDSEILTTEAMRIGRDPGGRSRLLLDDDQVSRKHTLIARDVDSDDVVVRDLGSRNGTYKNGERCDSSTLVSGDVLRVGSHVLLFQTFTMEECRHMLASPSAKISIVGPGARMQIVVQQIEREAPRDIPVMVLGETGVGKELVARELHELSGRDGSFVAVNCAALPEHLVESELFGHVSGAFTGATAKREGLFVEAEAGTLFLDEIGEMPLPIQAKLLRALATGEVRAVGGATTRVVKTRVVAATNVDLEQAVEEGSFRADLHARLLGSVIEVPPLRERRDDVLPLVEHFMSRDGDPVGPTTDAAEALLIYDWRYNVRELEQMIRAAAPHARAAGALDLEHLPDRVREPLVSRRATAPAASPEVPLALRIRRDIAPTAAELEEVLAYFDGNVAKVGDFFGKDRRQVYRWAERLDVDLNRFRGSDE